MPAGVRGCILVIIMTVCALAVPAAAQDTNYWTEQYGTHSDLLGGAVVGSLLDLSTVYYNPGAIALVEKPELLLSAKAFQYTTYDLGGRFEGKDLSSKRFGAAPTLFTGQLPFRWLKGKLAYSALTRQSLEGRLSGRISGSREVIPPPGMDQYGSEYLVETDLSENWYGLTWSGKIRDRVGLGISQWIVYRGHRTREQLTATAVSANAGGAATMFIDEYDYFHYRAVWKIGIAFDTKPVSYGFTVTTPSVGLFGWGSAHFNRSLTGFDIDGDQMEDPILFFNDQKDIDSNFKNPLSIAAGCKYQYRQTSLHATAEWFNRVRKFDVLEPLPFSDEIGGETLKRSLTHEMGQVVNVGLGIEHRLREYVSLSGAFTTDFSGYVEGTTTNHSITTWDIYHVTAGIALSGKGLDLTVGFAYAFGGDTTRRSIDFPVQDINDAIITDLNHTDVKYRRYKFIVAFAFSV